MNVLMLGWEYPPHISGGLGTACEGLTRGLSGQGVAVNFVVPKIHGGEKASHMNLLAANTGTTITGDRVPSEKLRSQSVPALLSPYWRPENYTQARMGLPHSRLSIGSAPGMHYGSDLFSEVARYAESTVLRFAKTNCDLIHAHDWMTYPAGIALSRVLKRPLVAHVHSLEYDRSGEGADPKIAAIEELGLSQAHTVVAVSHYTKSVIESRLSVASDKIRVVHNGVYPRKVITSYRRRMNEKLVLFLGRVTFQKGPEYFLHAARKVLDVIHDATFVMAGDGDMLCAMRTLAHDLGIHEHCRFPGFLRGARVEEMYARASVYVMPSVSEPFGIAPLEAISLDTPVIISRQSGVSEVLRHALKVDFWDVDQLARYMISALEFPELRNDMLSMAREELKGLRWELAAEKLVGVYRDLL